MLFSLALLLSFTLVHTVERIHISTKAGRRVLVLGSGEQTVQLFGASYVVKAAPWMPPLEVVRDDARRLAQQTSALNYTAKDAEGRPVAVRAVVRLGAIFAAAMPDGPSIDKGWVARFEALVSVFEQEGVYVFLDNHQDGLSSASGGEGLPLWMATRTQAAYPKEDLTISPQHPFKHSTGGWIRSAVLSPLLNALGVQSIQTMESEAQPWAAFSEGNVEGDDPRLQNIANPSVRLNNNDEAWEEARIVFTEQCQRLAARFFTSYKTADAPMLFEPYVEYISHLAAVWERHANVVAVELFNEPVFFGLPSLSGLLRSRGQLFDWYAAVLGALDDRNITAPVAYEDMFGGVGNVYPSRNPFGWRMGSSAAMSLLSAQDISAEAKAKLREWAQRHQLLFSFHYYPGTFVVNQPLAPTVALARAQAEYHGGEGGLPLWCSEFGSLGPPGSAAREQQGKMTAELAALGVPAATYWHLANTAWTTTEGWYKYGGLSGDPLAAIMHNATAPETRRLWANYVDTVRGGTSFGAQITGGNHGWEDVLPCIDAGACTSRV